MKVVHHPTKSLNLDSLKIFVACEELMSKLRFQQTESELKPTLLPELFMRRADYFAVEFKLE